MPANLPAEAKAKWIRVMEAKTPEEKLRALEDFLSAVPRHKGTEKLISQVRRQMATLRRQIERGKRQRRGGGGGFFVKKEGGAQAILIGLTNSGKSTLLANLTNAKPAISNQPYTTKTPSVGMMSYRDVKFQLVEAPALISGASSGAAWGPQVLAMARNADVLMIIIDLTMDIKYQVSLIFGELKNGGILVSRPKTSVEITRRGEGGIILVGELVDATLSDVERLLRGYKVYHALVKIRGKACLNDVEEALFSTKVYKPSIIIGTKADLLSSEDLKSRLYELNSIVPEENPVLLAGYGMYEELRESLGKAFMDLLDLIRIYTREPGSKEPSKEPLLMPKGSTVLDVAREIHSRVYKGFKYAKVWSSRFKVNPKRVGGDYVLADGDIVEIISG